MWKWTDGESKIKREYKHALHKHTIWRTIQTRRDINTETKTSNRQSGIRWINHQDRLRYRLFHDGVRCMHNVILTNPKYPRFLQVNQSYINMNYLSTDQCHYICIIIITSNCIYIYLCFYLSIVNKPLSTK